MAGRLARRNLLGVRPTGANVAAIALFRVLVWSGCIVAALSRDVPGKGAALALIFAGIAWLLVYLIRRSGRLGRSSEPYSCHAPLGRPRAGLARPADPPRLPSALLTRPDP